MLRRYDPSAQPIMNMALSSSRESHAAISRLAEDVLADKLRAIPGVASVNISGSLKRELSVLLRAERLREFNVSVSDVVNALRAQNTNAPVGKVRGNLTKKASAWSGASSHRPSFRTWWSSALTDRSFAWARWPPSRDGFADIDSLSIRSGKPNVGIFVTRSRDASTVTVADQVRKLVKELNTEFEKERPAPSSTSPATAASTRSAVSTT